MGHNGNGRGPFAPLRAIQPASSAQGVPLVGQPVAIKHWFVVVNVMCNCGAHEPVLVAGKIGAAAMCPACRRVVVVAGFRSNGQNIDFDFQFGMAAPEQPQADGTPAS